MLYSSSLYVVPDENLEGAIKKKKKRHCTFMNYNITSILPLDMMIKKKKFMNSSFVSFDV